MGTDAVELLAVSGDGLVLVGDPVFVPAVESGGVCEEEAGSVLFFLSPRREGRRTMNTENVDVGDLETGTLETADDPVKRAGSVSSGEDILVHEETPAPLQSSINIESSREEGEGRLRRTIGGPRTATKDGYRQPGRRGYRRRRGGCRRRGGRCCSDGYRRAVQQRGKSQW